MHWNTRPSYKVLIKPTVNFSKKYFRLLIAIKSTVHDDKLSMLLRRLLLNKTELNFTMEFEHEKKQVQMNNIFLIGKKVMPTTKNMTKILKI